MKSILSILCCLTMIISFSQNEITEKELPFIEVVGTATKEVIPDRIFIEIKLLEKTVDRKNYTIIEQESKLKAIVNSLNIDLDKLSLSDSNSDIIYRRSREKGIVKSKIYILEVNTTEQVGNVFLSLNNVDIKEVSIIKTEHSKIQELRKEVRIEAIKAAKNKAEYLLEAIDETLGKPIEIRELSFNNRALNNNLRANSSFYQPLSSIELDEKINFKVFEIKFSYFIKYSIKE